MVMRVRKCHLHQHLGAQGKGNIWIVSELSLTLDASIQVEGDIASDAQVTMYCIFQETSQWELEGFVRESDVWNILLGLLLLQLDPR